MGARRKVGESCRRGGGEQVGSVKGEWLPCREEELEGGGKGVGGNVWGRRRGERGVLGIEKRDGVRVGLE